MKYYFLFISLILISNSSLARRTPKLSKEFQDTLEIIIQKVESVIDQNWFVVKNDTGFTAYYCRTCQQEYLKAKYDFINRQIDNREELLWDTLTRSRFFYERGPDSIHFQRMLAMYRLSYDSTQSVYDRYPKNGILKLAVYFQPKWTQTKYDEILRLNDSLKMRILENKRKIDYYTFHDYRLFVLDYPSWPKTPEGYPIRRLPYESAWYNYSIFMVKDPNIFWTRAVFIDTMAENFYMRIENEIDPEINTAMRTLAFVLGINDFKFLEDYHPPLSKKNQPRLK